MAKNLVKSVIKALKVLDILLFEDIQRKGISLSDLSDKLGIRTNTLHNILKTMIFCGYVEQNEQSLYRAGSKAEQIGFINKLMVDNKDSELEKKLKELSKKIKETVVFYMLAGGNKVPVLKVEPDNIIKIDYSMINEQNFYSKPTGKILTAYASDYELELIKKRWGYPGKYWGDIDNKEELQSRLADIREKGYIENVSGNESLFAVAVPVIDSSTQLVGALGSYAPLFRCDNKKRDMIVTELKNTAANIKDGLNE